MLHLGPIWSHSEPSDVRYSENLLRPISWFGLFLQQNDTRIFSDTKTKIFFTILHWTSEIIQFIHFELDRPDLTF